MLRVLLWAVSSAKRKHCAQRPRKVHFQPNNRSVIWVVCVLGWQVQRIMGKAKGKGMCSWLTMLNVARQGKIYLYSASHTQSSPMCFTEKNMLKQTKNEAMIFDLSYSKITSINTHTHTSMIRSVIQRSHINKIWRNRRWEKGRQSWE